MVEKKNFGKEHFQRKNKNPPMSHFMNRVYNSCLQNTRNLRMTQSDTVDTNLCSKIGINSHAIYESVKFKLTLINK